MRIRKRPGLQTLGTPANGGIAAGFPQSFRDQPGRLHLFAADFGMGVQMAADFDLLLGEPGDLLIESLPPPLQEAALA